MSRIVYNEQVIAIGSIMKMNQFADRMVELLLWPCSGVKLEHCRGEVKVILEKPIQLFYLIV